MTISDFRRVRARIQPYIRTTPLVPCDIPGVFLKLESLQHTHSFKVRGAFARMMGLIESGETRTVLTVSAGNHGLGIARAAQTFRLRASIVVPASTPKVKLASIRSYGIEPQIEGSNYDEAEARALRLAANTKEYIFVSPYNDPLVMLGQGSLAFEILEQLPEVTSVVVPIGGGGLAAGAASVIKAIRPSIRVIGVQAEASAAIYHSLKAGHMVKVPDMPSIADGIAGNIDLETATFPIIQRNVDEVVLVSEAEIKAALNHIITVEKLIAEASAAAALAGVMTGKIALNGRAAVVITGGNIDLSVLEF